MIYILPSSFLQLVMNELTPYLLFIYWHCLEQHVFAHSFPYKSSIKENINIALWKALQLYYKILPIHEIALCRKLLLLRLFTNLKSKTLLHIRVNLLFIKGNVRRIRVPIPEAVMQISTNKYLATNVRKSSKC